MQGVSYKVGFQFVPTFRTCFLGSPGPVCTRSGYEDIISLEPDGQQKFPGGLRRFCDVYHSLDSLKGFI